VRIVRTGAGCGFMGMLGSQAAGAGRSGVRGAVAQPAVVDEMEEVLRGGAGLRQNAASLSAADLVNRRR